MFLSPQIDPEEEEEINSELPLGETNDEKKPFIRKLPEFKFWYQMTRALIICLFLTLTSMTDIPV